MLWSKVKAGALQLTLFVSVVIALLLTAFILLVHIHRQFQIQTDFIIETSSNADRGIVHILQNSTQLKDSTKIFLGDEDYKSLSIHRDYWGVFEKVVAVSKIKNNSISKCALIGGRPNLNERPSLYIEDNQKPLVLVGHTKIEGLAYLPKQGVKTGTIAGNSYYGNQLIYGPTRISQNFPKIHNEVNSQLMKLESELAQVSEDDFLELKNEGIYKNSFFETAKMVYSNQDLILSQINLTGQFIIQSKTKIIVEASAKLTDIVLIAPEIEIRANVKGVFQAISSQRISVGENVVLDYPSALVVNEKAKTTQIEIKDLENYGISVGSYSTIKGVLLFIGQPNPNDYDAQIQLKEDSTILGEVYCNRNIELQGVVLGTVYAHNFVAKQFGSIYQNHIYNGQILSKELSEKYSGINLNTTSKKDIMKWLY